MSKKILIVIDMQNDFITGSLGSEEAQAIVPIVAKKIKQQQASGGKIIFTLDTHFEDYLDTPEGKALPIPHCIKGTKGHQLSTDLDINTNSATSTNPETNTNPATSTNPKTNMNPATSTNPNTNMNPPTSTNPNVNMNPPTSTNPETNTNPATITNPNVNMNPPTSTNPNTNRNLDISRVGTAIFIEKASFGSANWADAIRDGDELELCGLCTDICVISNALILKTKYPNSKITVDCSACAGTSKEAHKAALTVMNSCQIQVTSSC